MLITRLVAMLALTAALLLAQAAVRAQGAPPSSSLTGILLLAHGGSGQWKLAKAVDREMPVEVALGMASRPSIQAAVDRVEPKRPAGVACSSSRTCSRSVASSREFASASTG